MALTLREQLERRALANREAAKRCERLGAKLAARQCRERAERLERQASRLPLAGAPLQ